MTAPAIKATRLTWRTRLQLWWARRLSPVWRLGACGQHVEGKWDRRARGSWR